jgi:hypothetical protein
MLLVEMDNLEMNQEYVLTVQMDANIAQISQHVNNAMIIKSGWPMILHAVFTAYQIVPVDKTVALDVVISI